MADIKWSAFPSTTSAASGDSVVGLHSGANERFLVSATPVASGLTLWDANRNLSANNIIPGFTTTVTTAGTTTLLASSTYQQYFTGSFGQTVLLPDVSTLVLGESFYIVNKSSAAIIIRTSASTLVQTMDSSSAALFTCVAASGTGANVWNVEYAVSQSGVTQRQVQTSAFNFAAGGGTTDAFVVNLNPAVTTLTDGMLVTMLANDFNATTTPTLQINSLPPKPIVNDLGALAAEDISFDGVYLFIYNSVNDNFVLINPSITNANAYLVQKNYFNYSPDIGAANAYVINLVLIPLVALAGGLTVISQIANANTGPSTLTLNGNIAPIVNMDGSALIANEIIAGGISEFIYSDFYNAFVLMNSAVALDIGSVLLNPSSNQTINGSYNLIMGTGSLVAPTILPGNLSLSSNSIISTDTNGDINLTPNGSGLVQIGSTTTITSAGTLGTPLQQLAEDNTSCVLSISSFVGNAANAALNFVKSRNSVVDGNTRVITDDKLGIINCAAADGTSFVNAASIVFATENVSPTGRVPTKIQFRTTTVAGGLTTALTIDSNHLATFSKSIVCRDGSISSGQAAGGFSGAFIGYSNTANAGSLSLITGNSAGNYANTLTNASTTAARTWTLPDASGTIALASGASGIVNAGLINELSWYASSGNAVSGLTTANNGLLVTSNTGVPSIGNSIGDNIIVNGIDVGQGSFIDGFTSNTVLGASALTNNVAGANNLAIGLVSLQGVINSSGNIGIGNFAGQINDGYNNVLIGVSSGSLLGSTTPGNDNIFFGSYVGNGGGNPSAIDTLNGSDNTWVGTYVCGSATTISGTIAIGKFALPDPSTGSTSITHGPSIAIGASSFPVGFRGDGTAYPAGNANYWRMKINNTYYKLPILPDSTDIEWPSTGTLATTSATPQWINVTTATTTIVPGGWYIANYTGGITVFNLPTTAALGTGFKIKGGLAGSGWQITQGAGQQINVGDTSSTVGVTGTLNSTLPTDYVSLTCLTADLYFSDTGFTGSLHAL